MSGGGFPWITLALLGLPVPALAVCSDFGLPDGTEIVELSTPLGSICIQLLRADAPATVENFRNYLDRGDFDDSLVHRSVPGFVIQGGGFRALSDEIVPVPTDPPVENEPCTLDTELAGVPVCSERGNERGTLAMARSASSVDSATSQWFINLADNRAGSARLDTQNSGFTVFGRVLGDGMDVADAIAALPPETTDKAFWLLGTDFPLAPTLFDNLPVLSPVPLLDAAFGCFDPRNLVAAVEPESDRTPIPDPETGARLFFLSGDCGTRIPRGSFVDGGGTAECPDPDLLTVGLSAPVSGGIRIDPDTGDDLQFALTCAETREALAQRALWRADYRQRFRSQLVVVDRAAVRVVPEPGAAGSAVGVLLALGLARWAHRARGEG